MTNKIYTPDEIEQVKQAYLATLWGLRFWSKRDNEAIHDHCLTLAKAYADILGWELNVPVPRFRGSNWDKPKF